jgi:hypothetical protein
MKITLTKSDNPAKKYKVVIEDETSKTIHFGSRPNMDFTKYVPKIGLEKAEIKKRNYINRHTRREDWMKSGIKTAGFWARWILWNKPTIEESIRDTERRFDIKID